jgi:hypothetical protein
MICTPKLLGRLLKSSEIGGGDLLPGYSVGHRDCDYITFGESGTGLHDMTAGALGAV